MFLRKNVDRRRNFGPKSKSKMAAVHHLGFEKNLISKAKAVLANVMAIILLTMTFY